MQRARYKYMMLFWKAMPMVGVQLEKCEYLSHLTHVGPGRRRNKGDGVEGRMGVEIYADLREGKGKGVLRQDD